MPLVALKACADYDQARVDAAVAAAVGLCGGMERFVRPGQSVLLKPNLLGAYDPGRRVTTDPAVVLSVGRLAQAAGGRLFIGDSPAIDGFGRTCAKTGIKAVAVALGAELVELLEPLSAATPPGCLRRRLDLARAALQADVVINIPKLKTHCMMLLTMGVKNLFGTVVAQRKSEWHLSVGQSRTDFANLLLDIHAVVAPALTILDGVWAMEGKGPSNGTPRHVGLVAASAHAPALDEAVAGLLGVAPKGHPVGQAAHDRGILGAEPVSLAGDDPASLRPAVFELPELQGPAMLPGPVNRFLQRRAAPRPVQNPRLCQACGKCAAICPAQCLHLDGRNASFDYNSCIRCYCCHEVCPADAIGFKRGALGSMLGVLGR